MITIKGKYSTATIMVDSIDQNVREQIELFVNNSSFINDSKIMPDLHYGKGAVIGFTMELGDRLISNVIGVDQSCGMNAVRISGKALDGVSMDRFDQSVRQVVPMSNKVNRNPVIDMSTDFNWKELNKHVFSFNKAYNKRYGTKFVAPTIDFKWFVAMCERVSVDVSYAIRSIGTMGGGKRLLPGS